MFVLDAISAVLIYRLTLIVLTTLVLLTLASQFGQFLYLELSTHFRLQYVIASIMCAVVLSAFQSWKFLPFALLCAILNGVYIGPYLTSNAAQKARTDGVHVRVFLANVLKSNTNYEAVLKLIDESNADIVVLQEVTKEWNEHLTGLQIKYPNFLVEPRLQGAGMAVFSRYPFDDIQRLELDESTHVSILAQVSLSGKSMTVLSMHPTTPVSPMKFKNRNLQFSKAAELMKKTAGPKVLIGDLNITMWSPYFTKLVQNSGLRDSRLGFGLNTSWPAQLPSFIRLPIDHCLVSEDVYVDKFKTGSRTGSDHRPIIVDLTF